MDPLPACLTIFLLIFLSGIFSLFESALNECRKARLEKRQEKRYKAVLKILVNPAGTGYLLISCRLWICILHVSAGLLTALAVMRHFQTGNSGAITAMALCVLAAGIFTALLSGGIPKLLSRIAPEKIAAVLLPVIKLLSFIMLPLSFPAQKTALYFNKKMNLEINDNSMTEDELYNALLEGEKSGIVESKERTMVEGVFYLGDRPVGAFMTHRSEIQWLDINAPYEEIYKKAIEYRGQRCFPVTIGGPDEIIGVVYLEDILLDMERAGLRAIMKKAQFIPETMSALKAFESFKQSQDNFLFVMDEYGGFAGVISIRALVEEIVGELSAPMQNEEPLIKQEDGSFIADGTLNIDEAAEALSLTGIPEERDFHTLAGFILHLSGELPKAGDSIEYQNCTFKVLEMDGNRIGKLLVSLPTKTP